jgi:hypothetical protein
MYASSNIIRVIKSRRMRWTGHVTQIGEIRKGYSILDVSVEWILETQGGK